MPPSSKKNIQTKKQNKHKYNIIKYNIYTSALNFLSRPMALLSLTIPKLNIFLAYFMKLSVSALPLPSPCWRQKIETAKELPPTASFIRCVRAEVS